ncbi:hypothetical protein DUPY_50460 [Duganella phyllosphaerae]|uniref:Uncharacterized protein n=1 Tax=Duganella phyllosphaerae TaxID=762836 RepID=A0A1E7W609_9BURK|nr:hypothetical protein DUPY_50460 [Duganella phyllosphaerae]
MSWPSVVRAVPTPSAPLAAISVSSEALGGAPTLPSWLRERATTDWLLSRIAVTAPPSACCRSSRRTMRSGRITAVNIYSLPDTVITGTRTGNAGWPRGPRTMRPTTGWRVVSASRRLTGSASGGGRAPYGSMVRHKTLPVLSLRITPIHSGWALTSVPATPWKACKSPSCNSGARPSPVRMATALSSSASAALDSARARSSIRRFCSRCWYSLALWMLQAPSSASGSSPIAVSMISRCRRGQVRRERGSMEWFSTEIESRSGSLT